MQEETEFQTFLPKSSIESDTPTVAGATGTSQGHLPVRTTVKFWTSPRNPRFFRLMNSKVAFLFFDPKDSVQQAAEYAAAHHPATDEKPIFNEVFVFYKKGNREIAITDVNVNFHSMFPEDDTMIVSNVPNIFELQQTEGTRILVSFLLVLFGLPLFLVFMLVNFA